MKKLTSAITIDAPRDIVWQVLTDQRAFPEWNPFITQLQGPLQPGATLTVRIHPPGGRAMTFRPRVLNVVEGQELRWLGQLFVPGVFDGEHHLWIAPAERGVVFHQDETFRGLLVPLTGSLLDKTQRGFEQMNEALKLRAEQGAAAVDP